jgi:hypothetical protein
MKYKIFKIDAARRQLEMACKLYLNEGDVVSIHTLTAAAHGVLDNVAEQRNIPSLKRSLIAMVKPEFKKETISKLNAVANFFKHADQDPNDHIDFDPEATELNLFDAILLHYNLTKEWTGWPKYFYWWFVMNNPDSLDYTKDPQSKTLIEGLQGMKLTNKMEFLDFCFKAEKRFAN